MKNPFKYRLAFYAKAGHWGERGWRRVPFWSRWLPLWLGEYVTKVELEKRR